MSRSPERYLTVLEKHLLNSIPLRHCDMTAREKVRTMIITEAYHLWLANKQIDLRKTLTLIAERLYDSLLQLSATDGEAYKLANAVGIFRQQGRGHSAIAQDMAALNHIIGFLDTPAVHIERAKVADSSDWLIREGMKRGDARSVKAGAAIKMQLHKNFDEDALSVDNLASTNINITGDVSVVKADQINYSDDEKRMLAKKYGLSTLEVEELVQRADGVYATAEPQPDAPHPSIYDEGG